MQRRTISNQSISSGLTSPLAGVPNTRSLLVGVLVRASGFMVLPACSWPGTGFRGVCSSLRGVTGIGPWFVERSLRRIGATGVASPATLQLNVPAHAMEPYTHHFVA